MRIRTLKPEWLDDERTAMASSDARVLSVALLLLADDYGNGRANRVMLAGRVFPGKPLKVFDQAWAELLRGHYLVEYTKDQQSYFSIRNWEKHQKVNHPGKPWVPPPCEDSLKVSRESLEDKRDPLDGPKDLRTKGPKDLHTCGAGSSTGAVSEIFKHWQSKMGKRGARLSNDRRTKIEARLREGYTVEQCKAAIDGNASSAWHQGENDRGKPFNTIELIFRNGEKLEEFAAMSEPAPVNQNVMRTPEEWARIRRMEALRVVK